jgi:hypothetical protein
MNIFVLDKNPAIAAKYHCDKHVVKMILESAQILSSVQHINGYTEDYILGFLYKKTHENHPCNIWARESQENYDWLCDLALNLCKEYEFRYGKTHKSLLLIQMCKAYKPKFTKFFLTDFALAMPDYCKVPGNGDFNENLEVKFNAVSSYREYYRKEKRNIAKWTKRDVPYWYF